MAVSALEALNREAAQLAAESLFSRSEWVATLCAIDGHPQRDELLRTICEGAAKTTMRPSALAAALLDALKEYARHEQSLRQVAIDPGISGNELPALTDGILRLAGAEN